MIELFALVVVAICFWILRRHILDLESRVASLESRTFALPTTVANAAPTALPLDAQSPVPAPAPMPAPVPSYAVVEKESGEESGARWLGWVGAAMLLLGVGFFLKYAFDHWIDPMGQVAVGILGGLLLVTLGQKLSEKYAKYAGTLTGAGIGILYFAIYAGFAFYDPVVIPQTIAFALMIMVTALAMVLAVVSGSLNLAVLGVVGGFFTPVMLSTGENHLVTLSLYMIVLNFGTIGVAWFKKWVQLNYLAFVGTIVLFGGWMQNFYSEDQLGITFVFLSIFFLMFLANSIVHHFSRQESSTPSDLLLLCLNALGYFGVCHAILAPHHDDYLGFFALLLAIVYLAVAYMAYTGNKHDRTLNLTLPGIAVVFLSVAIPLQFTGYWITIAWLVESLVLVFVGLSVRERTIQVFGWIVLLLGMVSMMDEVSKMRNDVMYSLQPDTWMPIANTAFALLVFGVVVFYGLAALYQRYKHPDVSWKQIIGIFIILANLLTIYTFTSEISQYYRGKIAEVNNAETAAYQEATRSGDPYADTRYGLRQVVGFNNYETLRALRNRENTAVSVLWALYATLLIVIGFAKRIRFLRMFGLIFFFVTACKVLVEVWAFGQIYRIISTIVVGVIALSAAFLYAKYKDRLKEIIYD